jgi:hypothetical protein
VRILIELSIAALLITMQTTAFSSNNYKDQVAEGYRWVNVDGPYASKFEDGKREYKLVRTPGDWRKFIATTLFKACVNHLCN